MLKRVLFFAVILISFSVTAMGQTNFEQSQARLIEPKQDVFIRPLVAEIQILNDSTRMHFMPSEFEISSIDELTYEQLENFKARALYNAALEGDADIIIAATFKVKAEEKGKKLVINVSGYPGKYHNFKPASSEAGDYEWIRTVYPLSDRVYDAGKTKAVKDK